MRKTFIVDVEVIGTSNDKGAGECQLLKSFIDNLKDHSESAGSTSLEVISVEQKQDEAKEKLQEIKQKQEEKEKQVEVKEKPVEEDIVKAIKKTIEEKKVDEVREDKKNIVDDEEEERIRERQKQGIYY